MEGKQRKKKHKEIVAMANYIRTSFIVIMDDLQLFLLLLVYLLIYCFIEIYYDL